ncbi:MAG: acyltransferase, partial [Planctomycetota bacterium]|nr:acyltransferase [Planctomycetota bacterium]
SSHEATRKGLPIMHRPIEFAPVIIEDGADIGAGAILLPGVRIGRQAQVGAGSVVTGNVPAHYVVAGCPARRLGRRR